jgi:hypothetical protein
MVEEERVMLRAKVARLESLLEQSQSPHSVRQGTEYIQSNLPRDTSPHEAETLDIPSDRRVPFVAVLDDAKVGSVPR